MDQITLLQENTRLRRIVNFNRRPQAPADELTDATLVGFGVEVRT